MLRRDFFGRGSCHFNKKRWLLFVVVCLAFAFVGVGCLLLVLSTGSYGLVVGWKLEVLRQYRQVPGAVVLVA